jgi:PBP1b-binding outer membrane lipoprotein LpoB
MKYVQAFKWILLALFIAGCSSTGSEKMETMDPNANGFVTIDETQVMLILGGSHGTGTLKY